MCRLQQGEILNRTTIKQTRAYAKYHGVKVGEITEANKAEVWAEINRHIAKAKANIFSKWVAANFRGVQI